jgi:hypothetical protein
LGRKVLIAIAGKKKKNMLHVIKRIARKSIKAALGVVGLEVVSKAHHWQDVKQFIPFEETMAGAKEAGLSLGAYIDVKHNVPGATQAVHDQLAGFGIFNERIDRVCEIGPGSGRYLEKTLQACKPSHYEVYETARPWADWLNKTYHVVCLPTDGKTLAATPSASIDLIQAHKVFVVTLFLTTCSYFQEIVRVTRPGAWIIFDIMTEDCMDTYNLDPWIKTGLNDRTYPAIMPKNFAIDFFQKHGIGFVGSFLVPMKPGKTECMVFRKQGSPKADPCN